MWWLIGLGGIALILAFVGWLAVSAKAVSDFTGAA